MNEVILSAAEQRFEAVIYRIGQLRCVDVPPEVSEALGGEGRIAVRVKIGRPSARHPCAGRAEGQTSLVPRRDGGHRLFIAAPLRKSAGVDSGDRVYLEVRPDTRGGEPDLPEELVAALGSIAGGLEALLTRSPADRRQLVRWIEQPKSPEARRGRVNKAVEMVLRGPPKKSRRRA